MIGVKPNEQTKKTSTTFDSIKFVHEYIIAQIKQDTCFTQFDTNNRKGIAKPIKVMASLISVI